MKPSLQPIALPIECASYGDEPFQPLVLPEPGFVVVGGPNAIYVISMKTPPKIELELRAVDRIAGFAVNQGYLYVQDGTVLSRWSMSGKPTCVAAVNVLTKKRYTNASPNDVAASAPDWAALHELPPALQAKREQLKAIRRRLAWVGVFNDAWRVRSGWTDADGPRKDYDRLSNMTATLFTLLKLPQGYAVAERGYGLLDAEIASALAPVSQLDISAPVVRTHAIWGKRAAMVFVIGRDGTVHPFDDALERMGTWHGDRGARPELAITEYETVTDSDEWACRLYYVDEEGGLQALDGDALPPVALPSWDAKTKADPSRIRLRVIDKLVWGGGASGANLFAFPVDQPTAPSRVRLKLPGDDWRWLEVRPEASLALVSSSTQSRLVAFANGATTVDRWGPRGKVAPCFGTFLPASSAPKDANGRPLLVLEVDRTTPSGQASIPFRVFVANTADGYDGSAPIFPPTPQPLFTGTFDAWSNTSPAPREVMTQPSVSRQDVYFIARTATALEELRPLIDNTDPGSWMAQVRGWFEQKDPSAAMLAAPLPSRRGQQVFYCYGLGNSITSDQARAAWTSLDELKALATPVRLLIVTTERWMFAGDKHWQQRGPSPLRNAGVTLRFSNGTSRNVSTNRDGIVTLQPDVAGLTVTMDSIDFRGGQATSCRLDRFGENRIEHEVSWIE